MILYLVGVSFYCKILVNNMFVGFIEICCLIFMVICFIIIFKCFVVGNGFVIIKCIVRVIMNWCYLYCSKVYISNVFGVV